MGVFGVCSAVHSPSPVPGFGSVNVNGLTKPDSKWTAQLEMRSPRES
jgi:hypothetical protein